MALSTIYWSDTIRPAAGIGVFGTPYNMTLPTVPASQSSTLPSPQVPVATGYYFSQFIFGPVISSADTLTVRWTFTYFDGTTKQVTQTFASTTQGAATATNANWTLALFLADSVLGTPALVSGQSRLIVATALDVSSSVGSSASQFNFIAGGRYG